MPLGDQMKYNKWGGVLYGYDNRTIRIWTNTHGGTKYFKTLQKKCNRQIKANN